MTGFVKGYHIIHVMHEYGLNLLLVIHYYVFSEVFLVTIETIDHLTSFDIYFKDALVFVDLFSQYDD